VNSVESQAIDGVKLRYLNKLSDSKSLHLFESPNVSEFENHLPTLKSCVLIPGVPLNLRKDGLKKREK